MTWLVLLPDLDAWTTEEDGNEEVQGIENRIDSYQKYSQIVGNVTPNRAENPQNQEQDR